MEDRRSRIAQKRIENESYLPLDVPLRFVQSSILYSHDLCLVFRELSVMTNAASPKKISEKWVSYWPKSEQPRERLMAQGADALTEAELLAIFLRVGVKGMSVLDLSRLLLQRFEGLRGLFKASEQDLRK